MWPEPATAHHGLASEQGWLCAPALQTPFTPQPRSHRAGHACACAHTWARVRMRTHVCTRRGNASFMQNAVSCPFAVSLESVGQSGSSQTCLFLGRCPRPHGDTGSHVHSLPELSYLRSPHAPREAECVNLGNGLPPPAAVQRRCCHVVKCRPG